MTSGPALEPLPDGLVSALAEQAAYPGDPTAGEGVRHVQTHISHVFLTGGRVYKLRKAVDLGFLCFARRAERNADCLSEVALNRRLAPDVYLGVAAVRPRDGERGGGFRVAPETETLAGDAVEHVVVMRRLPDGRDALTLLGRGALRVEQLDAVAARLAAFHEAHGLGRPAPFSPEDWRRRIEEPVEANFRALAEAAADPDTAVSVDAVAAAREAAQRFAAARAERFEERRRNGRAVDGHGDLHLDHVWFETDGAEPLLVDCIEFSEALRRIDGASDAAFLAMDLAYRDRESWAERFLRRYARDRDDFQLYAVVDYYASYRAGVRAKVAAIASREPEVEARQRTAAAASARRHLALARRALEARGRGAVLVVSGVVGTGKSTAAEALADTLGAVVVASDRVRKRMAGLAPTARRDDRPDAGLYAPEKREAVYAGLLERAAPVLDSGRPVVLDATFAEARHRAAARALATERGVPFRVVETRCAPDEARRRLAERAARGGDPSDAGPELYDTSVARYEPVREAAPGEHVVVETDRPGWRERAAEGVALASPFGPGGAS